MAVRDLAVGRAAVLRGAGPLGEAWAAADQWVVEEISEALVAVQGEPPKFR